MVKRKSKNRKMDRRTINKIVDESITKDKFSVRTQVNTENIRLLLADPDFSDWAEVVRNYNGIPIGGFKSEKQVEKWQRVRDEEKWERSIAKIYLRYTKINEPYIPYVKAFVLFDNHFNDSAIKPVPSFTLGKMQIFFGESHGAKRLAKSIKLPQMQLNIYYPLTESQWEHIKKESKQYFEEFDMHLGPKAPKPLGKNIKQIVLALQRRKPNDPILIKNDGFPPMESDKQLVNDAFPNAPEEEIKKMVRNLPQKRNRAKDLLVTRLGKTDGNIDNTKPY